MKNMLKGIRRLAIATLTVCGVGLFLFGSEVKAAEGSPVDPPVPEITVTVNPYDSANHEYSITFGKKNTTEADVIKVSKIVWTFDGTASKDVTTNPDLTIGTDSIEKFNPYDYFILGENSLSDSDIPKLLVENKFNLKTVVVTYTINGTEGTYSPESLLDYQSENIYKITSKTINSQVYDTIYSGTAPASYSVTISKDSEHKRTFSDTGYAYSGLSYSISAPSSSDIDLTKYYVSGVENASVALFDSGIWQEGSSNTVFQSSHPVIADTSYNVAYLPKIGEISITKPVTTDGKVSYTLPEGSNNKTGTVDFDVEVKYIPLSGSSADYNIIAKYGIFYSLKNNTNNKSYEYGFDETSTNGDQNKTKSWKMGGIDKDAIDPNGYKFTVGTVAGVLDTSTGKLTKELTKDITVEMKTKDSPTPDPDPTKSEIDSDKTLEAFKKGKNYITASNSSNSTKFELDLNKAFVLLDKDGKEVTGRTITWSKTSGDADLSSDGKLSGSKYSEVKLQAVVKKGDVEEITIKDIPVTVYPMPEVKYTSGKGSSRKLDISVPAKISTGDVSENIDNVSGFKLELADSNGNVLYSYDDGKYATVVKDASVSDGVKKYSVSYSDIEAMITSAASNGKFSADSTPVYFKVTPIGYKTGASSTSRANDKIFGKSDNTNVYKVTATGENIVASTAYGLEGQEIKLTATPVTGYTFSKWSDGNTSPTKTVTVSASTGSNVYRATAVLGTRQDGTLNPDGTAGTGGYDDVPKTAESNAPIWIILIMVFAFIGGGYALFLQIRPQEENR